MTASGKRVLRWGILGTARINEKIIPHLHASERSELSAIASRDTKKAIRYVREWNIPHAYETYDELIKDPDIDILYLSLPNHLHFEWAKAALEKGKHVLCEKPLALHAHEADTLAALAKSRGLHLAEGFMYRHQRQSIELIDLARAGKLGHIRRVQGSFHITLPDGPNIRTNAAAGGGASFDVGCYLVNFTNALIGRPPISVFAHAEFKEDADGASYDDLLSAVLDFGDGETALLDCGFRGPRIDEMQILFDQGWVEVAHPFKASTHEEVRISRKPTKASPLEVEHLKISDPDDAYLSEVKNFEDVLLIGGTPRIETWESAAGIRTLEAFLTSAREKRLVRLDSLASI